MNDLMLQLSKTASMPVLQNRTARAALGILVFALLTALGAHIAIPLIGGVPVTMQTLFVTLAGALLGPYLGAASQLLYLAIGAAGAPVFALGGGLLYLLGPTGGYLLAYPLAAAVTGRLAADAQPGLRGIIQLCIAMFIATGIILLLGWAQLSLITGDAARAFDVGVAPFLIGDVLKVVLAALIVDRIKARTLRRS